MSYGLIVSRVGALIPYVSGSCNATIAFSADLCEAGNLLQAQLQRCVDCIPYSCLRVLRCSIFQSFDSPQTWSTWDCVLGPLLSSISLCRLLCSSAIPGPHCLSGGHWLRYWMSGCCVVCLDRKYGERQQGTRFPTGMLFTWGYLGPVNRNLHHCF